MAGFARAAVVAMLGIVLCAHLATPAAAQRGDWVASERGPGWKRQVAPTPTQPREMDLQAADDGLARIEAGTENPQDGQIRTESVTDVLVRLRHALRQYRGAAAASTREAERSFVEAQVMAVVRGRISPAGIAQCDTFEGDLLVCTVECDGGSFGLRRGRRPGEHILVMGIAGRDGEASSTPTRQGFRLGACATGQGPPLMLLPRSGRLGAEIRLLEQR